MSFTSAFAIYFVIWWVMLFAVLPWGIRSQHEDGDFTPGSDPGAPVLARIWTKLALNTVLSAVFFGVCYFLYVRQIVTLEDLATLWGLLG